MWGRRETNTNNAWGGGEKVETVKARGTPHRLLLKNTTEGFDGKRESGGGKL